jgi:general secretion pathway protein K
MSARLSSPPNRSAGTAIISALLIVALVAITAGAMLAQQSQALVRTEASVGRAQVRAYSDTALQWARGILFDDANRGTVDHLGEGWAGGLAALPVESAVISGMIQDEQGRFNLNNLVRDGRASPQDVLVFRRLLEKLSLQPDLAGAVVDWIDPDSEVSIPGGAEDATYLAQTVPYRAANRPMVSIEELARVRGFDAKTIKRLRPFITALPAVTRINLNTARDEVIAAALPDVGEAERNALIAERAVKPFKDLDDIRRRVPKAPVAYVNSDLDVKSDFFLASVAIVSSDAAAAQVRAQALLKREPGKWPVIIWQSSL